MSNLIEGYFKAQQTEQLGSMEYFSFRKLRAMAISPMNFFKEYNKRKVFEPTKAMKYGNLVHIALLEGKKFRERYIKAPEFTGFTKDGKPSTRSADALQKKELWYMEQAAAGRIVVTEQEMENLIEIVDNVMDHSTARELLTGGRSEAWAYADFSGDENVRRWFLGRSDFLTSDLITVEVKTTSRGIDAYSFANECGKGLYMMQLAGNTKVNSKLHGLKESNRKGAFIAICTKTNDVAAHTVSPDNTAWDEAHAQLQKSMDLINHYLKLDPLMQNKKLWPGIQRGKAEELIFAPWHFKQTENYLTTEDIDHAEPTN